MVKKLVVLTALILAAFSITGTAWGDTVPVTNASFESISYTLPSHCPVPYNQGCAYNHDLGIPGWSVTNGGSFQPSVVTQTSPLNGYFFSIPDGSLVGYTNGGTISQTLAATALSNNTYTMSVFVGDRLDGFGGTYTLSLETIIAGGTVTGTICSLSGNTSNIQPGTWVDESCTGTPTSSGNLYLFFQSTGQQLDVDNVSVNYTAVPEPSSVLLLAIGVLAVLAGFLFSRRNPLALNA